MFERMLDKAIEPTKQQIQEYMGEDSYARLCAFESSLAAQYSLSVEIRFPFGNGYGWGYKCSHKTFHLCYAFFEKNAFTITIQIGDKQVPAVEKIIAELTPETRKLWAERYPCGEHGGWIHCRISKDSELADAIRLINAKKAPQKAK